MPTDIHNDESAPFPAPSCPFCKHLLLDKVLVIPTMIPCKRNTEFEVGVELRHAHLACAREQDLVQYYAMYMPQKSVDLYYASDARTEERKRRAV